jgi:bifunctional hydroxylase/dehydrase
MVMSAPLGEGVDRIIVCERGTPPKRRSTPPTFEEVASAWQRLTGEDISHGEGRWVSAFGDATRQVTEYRRGRVLIAGDAAHVHLPAGGQGLSVSVQDVFNLGWKLGAAVGGWAPPDLLDSYHRERHPVGARLLMNTQAQGMLYLSGEDMEPLRGVFAELMRHDEVLRHLSGMVSGLAIRYDLGSEHPLAGMRLPKADLVSAEGKTTTIAPLQQGLGAFLDFSDDAALCAVAGRWPERVNVVAAQPHGLSPASPLTGVPALLARPDGYVAWAGTDAAELAGALERWFGPATA